MLRVCIGWDSRFPEPAKVLAYSLYKHASIPLDIRFLDLKSMEVCYGFQRDLDPLQSTEFTYTRFLVPYLCHYHGRALFLDNDMLCLSDIKELDDLPMYGLALRVVKHDHQVVDGSTKMYGAVQTSYPRKNWSSAMLMNCEQLRSWTKVAVERQSGKYLHRFEGISDAQIGDLPREWNDLDHMDETTKMWHGTSGGPWYSQYQDCSGADTWRSYRDQMYSDIGHGLYP